MNPQMAQQAYQQAQQSHQETLWLIFAFFVAAPIIVLVSAIIVKLLLIQKCPKCGSKRNKVAVETVDKYEATYTQRVRVCGDCGTVLS